jgi:hypothetical protein
MAPSVNIASSNRIRKPSLIHHRRESGKKLRDFLLVTILMSEIVLKSILVSQMDQGKWMTLIWI